MTWFKPKIVEEVVLPKDKDGFYIDKGRPVNVVGEFKVNELVLRNPTPMGGGIYMATALRAYTQFCSY